jgi:hypothetical protein
MRHLLGDRTENRAGEQMKSRRLGDQRWSLAYKVNGDREVCEVD